MHFRPNPLLYGAHQGFFSTFKVVVSLRDPLEHHLVKKAVDAAIKRYPYFCVFPQKHGDSIRLQHNPAPVPVLRDGRCVGAES